MEERNPELEMLAKIHNQLVDLKTVIVEIELAKPGTSHSLQTRLRQLIGTDQHVSGDGEKGAVQERQQKVIAPDNLNIVAGEATVPPPVESAEAEGAPEGK